MAKRKVTQDDLRKMMADVKASKSAPTSTSNKKYKLSSRELLLLEEQRQEDERKKAREREKKAAALAALPPPDAVPAKSILKNKVLPKPYRPPIPNASASVKTSSESFVPVVEIEKSKFDSTKQVSATSEAVEEEKSGALPEGFFDDPVLDAKARHVQYVDTASEEWDRFQKEIVDELNVAQDILVEDRIEATMDRQIEEIDDQMRAWTRVAEMEKMKEEKVKEVHQNLADSKSTVKDDDDDLEDFEEFLDWRKKK